MAINHALNNSTVLPSGAQVVRRALVRSPQGIVTQHQTFYAGGEFRTVSHAVNTINRGALVPSWRLPGRAPGVRIIAGATTGDGGPNGGIRIATENQFQQTARQAPVGTQGTLVAPLPKFARQAKLFGAPPSAR